ncbi:MAG TPA: hypothetical protein GX707_11400 [Epulopiscium sp.]|nr:hypothetical protein [Candidatus Epulonipiscium sp.]
MKRIFKLSMVFVMMATIYFAIGRSITLVNSVLTFSFLAILVCISWTLFSYINKSVYIRLILLIAGFVYIYSGDAKDIMILTYIVLVFIVLGLIHTFIKVIFLDKSKGFTEGLKILFEQVSNYNTVIVISFIMVFLDDFVFYKIYRDFHMDYFEILITILMYYLIIEFAMLRMKDKKNDTYLA